jgi:cytochrome c biogenesis protein CcmG/thiol:disulfide interchange protein DsbE
VLKVSVKEKEEALNKYKKEFNVSSPLLMDEKAKVANSYGVWAHPTTFFINRQGKIVGREFGGREWTSESMTTLIEYLLSQQG